MIATITRIAAKEFLREAREVEAKRVLLGWFAPCQHCRPSSGPEEIRRSRGAHQFHDAGTAFPRNGYPARRRRAGSSDQSRRL
jgi:hypothetical protein